MGKVSLYRRPPIAKRITLEPFTRLLFKGPGVTLGVAGTDLTCDSNSSHIAAGRLTPPASQVASFVEHLTN